MIISRSFIFDTMVINKSIEMDDGETFTIFRHVIVKGRSEPEAYFLVRFKPKSMSIKANIKFSLLPMMIFMGFKGFRSKYWTVDYKSGLCQGLYEWQTVKDAENYSKSIAMKFMIRRSELDSIMFKVIDKANGKLEYWIT